MFLKCSWLILSKIWIFIRALNISTYYFLFSWKETVNCSYKIRYKRYLELICRYLLYDMCIELTCMKSLYEEIIYVYEKAHVMVM